MAISKLTDYLDKNGKKYVIVTHSEAFTAQEVAASAHIPGKDMVKTVMIKADGDMKMVVLPSTHDVDFNAIREALDADDVELASEEEFKSLFPESETGAMPPFGNLYDIDTLVAESLTNGDIIAFNAGNHKEVIKLAFSDYEELVQPDILPVGVKHA